MQVFAEKQLKELKNGRLAMIAVLGELMAQQVSGYGTYEQLTCCSSRACRCRSRRLTKTLVLVCLAFTDEVGAGMCRLRV